MSRYSERFMVAAQQLFSRYSCLLSKNGHVVVYSLLSSPDRGWRIFAEQLMFPPRKAAAKLPLNGGYRYSCCIC